MRGVSTVLDVTLFLLLVSVAVVTLAVPAADPPAATAEQTAETLATATANVTYHPAGGHGPLAGNRTASGTHAALLGRSAVANLTFDGERLAPHTASFRAAVREHTEAALAWSPGRTGVVAVWEPYPDAPLRGRAAAGASPPPGVEVSTATLTVPAPIPAASRAANRSASDGFRGVARAVTERVLRTTVGAGGADGSGGAAAGGRRADRLGAYADALDGSTLAALARDVATDGEASADAAVERRLSARLAADMRDRYDSPAAAAAAVETGTVRIVVREWSP